MYGLETVALSKQYQRRPRVCENNWIRRIAGVKRVERRRMKDLTEDKENSRCKESGEKENERPNRRSWN